MDSPKLSRIVIGRRTVRSSHQDFSCMILSDDFDGDNWMMMERQLCVPPFPLRTTSPRAVSSGLWQNGQEII